MTDTTKERYHTVADTTRHAVWEGLWDNTISKIRNRRIYNVYEYLKDSVTISVCEPVIAQSPRKEHTNDN